MKPLEATWWEGRGVRRGGYLEPFVLLEPPAHNPMQLRVRLDRQLRNVCLIFRVLRLVAPLDRLDPPYLDSLDAPAPCAWTPLKLVLLNVLDLCLFFTPPASYEAAKSEVRMHLSAACSHVVDIFNTLRKGHVDSRKISPNRLLPRRAPRGVP